MPLDPCYRDLFEPGHIASDPGISNTPRSAGYLLATVNAVSASLSGAGQATPSTNFGDFLFITISGTWVGRITFPFGAVAAPFSQFTSNVSMAPLGQIFFNVSPSFFIFASGPRAGFNTGDYTSGTAVVTLVAARKIGIIGTSSGPPYTFTVVTPTSIVGYLQHQ